MSETNIKESIDFSGKDFEETQRFINTSAKISSLQKHAEEGKDKQTKLIESTIKGDDANDIIQEHLSKFETPDDLGKYLSGKVTDPKIKERINSFFTNEETGEVLELVDKSTGKTESDELTFKRDLLFYFKENDYYLAKIDEEIEKMNQATEEFNTNMTSALNPLKDNILAYSEYLIQESNIEDTDDAETRKLKTARHKKAIAIRSGYTFENLIEIINEHPSIVSNSLRDFHTESNIQRIGERYAHKLKSNGIEFNLFPLLSDDVKDSLEYRTLPIGEYPEGLENFTVFFIIRSMSMSLTSKEDIVFHASAQIALSKLMDGTLDPDVAETVKSNIQKLLSYFA